MTNSDDASAVEQAVGQEVGQAADNTAGYVCVRQTRSQ